MADQVEISQVHAQVEWQEPGNNLVSQVHAQVEWQEPGNNLVSQLFIQVEWVGADIVLPPVTQEEIDESYYSGMGNYNFSGGVKEPQIWRY